MRTRTKSIVAAVTAATLIGTTAAVTAAADSGSSTAGPTTCSLRPDGAQLRGRMGPGFGPAGPGYRLGGQQAACDDMAPSAPAVSGVLTDRQRIDLAEMAQEEKLAHDLYLAFAELFDDQRFDTIASAETQHLSAVRSMLTAYDIADPTLGMAEGEFTSGQWQSLYDQLLAAGSTDLASALEAGATVERTDIADLQSAGVGVDAPDVEQVYTHLLSGSRMHLQAFTR